MSSYTSFRLVAEAQNVEGESLKKLVVTIGQVSDTGKTLKVDSAAGVSRVRIGEEDLIVKRYTARSVWHRVKRALRQSRARNAWRASVTFADAGIRVPEPVLYWENRFGPLRFDSFFVYRAIDGEILLESLPTLLGEQRADVVRQLGALFSALRSQRLVHGDMKATNLMLVDGRVTIFDLDVAGKRTCLFGQGHRRDQKRFLKNWADNEQLIRELAKQIAGAVELSGH